MRAGGYPFVVVVHPSTALVGKPAVSGFAGDSQAAAGFYSPHSGDLIFSHPHTPTRVSVPSLSCAFLFASTWTGEACSDPQTRRHSLRARRGSRAAHPSDHVQCIVCVI